MEFVIWWEELERDETTSMGTLSQDLMVVVIVVAIDFCNLAPDRLSQLMAVTSRNNSRALCRKNVSYYGTAKQ